ncbi:MAG: hypothetical protein HUK25_03520, partial [Treponema sp.]|nr:hypothetical protein [Treponema sp.]
MKKIILVTIFLLSIFSFNSCFVTTMAVDKVSQSLSGRDKKGATLKKKKDIPPENQAMYVITSESDITLIEDFFPSALVMYEIVLSQNPDHLGLKGMTGSLHIMYANAFIQSPADLLGIEDFDLQNNEYKRAEYHYLKGRDMCISVLDSKHPGFKKLISTGDEKYIKDACAMLTRDDVETAYWAGSGWLGAFALNPINPNILGNLSAPVAILERCSKLDPDYSKGAVWEVLARFYASAPSDFGGDKDHALLCISEAMRCSGGNTPGPYIIMAECFCIPKGEQKAFTDYLNKALDVNPD